MNFQYADEPNTELRLSLMPMDEGKPRVVFSDGNEYNSTQIKAYFYVDENEPEIFMVTATEMTREDVLLINNGPVRLMHSRSIRHGDVVRLEGITYRAEIKAVPLDTTMPRSPYNIPLYTQTIFALHPGDRERQEDALGFAEADVGEVHERIWVVADGVTNAHEGDVASRFTTQYVMWRYFNSEGFPQERLRQAILEASDLLVERGNTLTEHYGESIPIRCASTVAAVVLTQVARANVWYVALVGDSRVHLLRNRFDLKECSAEGHFTQGKLHYALGKPGLTADVIYLKHYKAAPNDFVLLTSDGVSDLIKYQHLNEVLRKAATSPQRDSWWNLPAELVEAAIHTEYGDDNATAVLVHTDHTAPSPIEYETDDPQVCIGLGDSSPKFPPMVERSKPSSKVGGLLNRIFSKK